LVGKPEGKKPLGLAETCWGKPTNALLKILLLPLRIFWLFMTITGKVFNRLASYNRLFCADHGRNYASVCGCVD
jgi:hypothetical protein